MLDRSVVLGAASLALVLLAVGAVATGVVTFGPLAPDAGSPGETTPPGGTTVDPGATATTTSPVATTTATPTGEATGTTESPTVEPTTDTVRERPSTTTTRSTTTVEDDPSPTTTATTTTTTPSPTTTTEEDSGGTPAFAFDVADAGSCGLTCRSVTSEVTNTGSGPALDLTAEVTLFAGDRKIWEGTEEVGRLDPGETIVVTRKVDVGIDGAVAIQRNDGFIDVQLVLRHAGGVEVYRETQKVT